LKEFSSQFRANFDQFIAFSSRFFLIGAKKNFQKKNQNQNNYLWNMGKSIRISIHHWYRIFLRILTPVIWADKNHTFRLWVQELKTTNQIGNCVLLFIFILRKSEVVSEMVFVKNISFIVFFFSFFIAVKKNKRFCFFDETKRYKILYLTSKLNLIKAQVLYTFFSPPL